MKATRNFWPLGIITAFILFFIGMATVVVIAATHRDYLVNDNYYEQELKYQTQIDASASAEKSGATLNFDSENNQVFVTLPVAHLSKNFFGTIEL